MELRTLEYFIAVAEEQSFTRAAARFHVAQSAVSQQVRGLERELGERLFERSTRRVRLSSAGQALMPYARTVVNAVSGAKTEFAARTELLCGNLTLGTVEGAENTPFPAALGMFHRRYPGVLVQLHGGTSEELLRKVGQGALDAALIALPQDGLAPGFGSRVMLRDEIVAVVPAHEPDAELALTELSDVPLITYGPDSGLRPHLRAAFDAAGVPFKPTHETNYVALQVALVVAGVGTAVAVGADRAIHGEPRVRARPFSPAIPYTKALVWRTEPAPAAPLRALLALTEHAS